MELVDFLMFFGGALKVLFLLLCAFLFFKSSKRYFIQILLFLIFISAFRIDEIVGGFLMLFSGGGSDFDLRYIVALSHLVQSALGLSLLVVAWFFFTQSKETQE